MQSFLEDHTLRLEGYQASFVNPEKGLFLFTHVDHECGTTLSIRAGLLKELAPNTHVDVNHTGQDGCPGYCLDEHNFDKCDQVCDMRWVRDLLPLLEKHELTPARMEQLKNDPMVRIDVSPERRKPGMVHLEWKPAYSVGIEKFDNQHKQLFDIVNQMGESISKGEDHDTLRAIFKKLIEYTRIHFRDEEANLLMYGYENYHEHKLEHDELVAQVVDFALDFCANPEMTLKTMTFLEGWIIGHILGTDKGYTELLKEKDIIDWE
ncbi:bacteriohemerythrin [bacterium]|nr:bacteriohemerythrin [bacterium]